MIPEHELRQMYIDEKMSQREIAEEVGMSQRTVCYRMEKYSIKSRTKSESRLIGARKLSKEELEQMYLDWGMSQYEIASEAGMSRNTVNDQMKKYGIKLRTCSEAKLNGIQKLSKEELEQMYWDQKMSQSEIASEIGVSCHTVGNWMKECDIKSRTFSEARVGKFIGENSPGWKGGISFKPYCNKFNNMFRNIVRERDDYTCQLCGHEQKLGGRELDVHHIHYDKENCYPNVVTLCRSCNVKVNSNRDYWEQYFENLLLEKGMLNWTVTEMV